MLARSGLITLGGCRLDAKGAVVVDLFGGKPKMFDAKVS
jgi:hypothetical protein